MTLTVCIESAKPLGRNCIYSHTHIYPHALSFQNLVQFQNPTPLQLSGGCTSKYLSKFYSITPLHKNFQAIGGGDRAYHFFGPMPC